MVWKSEGMKAIPRLIAGTAVCLAAVLTTAPVTAGIADFVLNPGQQPIKRAAPALSGSRTPPVGTIGTRDEKAQDERTSDESPQSADHSGASEFSPDAFVSAAGHSAGLVAHTAADAQSRVTDLASDLQSGVEAGEFSQAEADRVLGDLSSYIKGERTWPERSVA